MIFAVIEVGSTNTRGYICKDNNINELKPITIEFKRNYKINNKIDDIDIESLCNYINNIKDITLNIHIYGTSIFRNISSEEKEMFLNIIKDKTGYNFNIVSSDEENEYTVYGVISKVDYKGRIAVMIGGGGSTELAIIQNKKVIETCNSSFGVMDIIEKYPDTTLDKTTTPYEEVLNYTESMLKKPNNKADILVLAGGSYIKFYDVLDYKLDKNSLYFDNNQPYMINKEQMDKYDLDFYYHKSLDEVMMKDIENSKWWEGARGMRICVEAITSFIDAKYVIPTKITMIYGIVAKLCNEVYKQ